MNNSRQPRRKFSQKYRIAAVKMVTEQDYKVAEAARELGIGDNLLHRWKEKLADESKNGDR